MKKKDQKIAGVILAAGKGSRIKPLNFESPKPLLLVCNKPIMEYQIEEMKELGIKDIFIVIGHLGAKIKNHFQSGKKWGVKITYVKQKQQLGIAHAVGQLEPYLKTPFLMFLGDIFYVAPDLGKMIGLFYKKKAAAVLAVKKEKDAQSIKRNFSLNLNKNGSVKRVIEKPSYTTNNLKGCGIYFFDLKIFDAVRNTPRTAMRDEYEITNSIQLLVDYGYRVYPANVISWDMNITFAKDLLLCNLSQLKRLRKKTLIDPEARVKFPHLMDKVIVGPKAKVLKPIRITNSVIYPKVNLKSPSQIAYSLITSSSRVYCLKNDGQKKKK